MLSNVAETFHSSAKLKNKQLAKIWGLKLKKQRFGDTLYFPEHLEDSPFRQCDNFIHFEISWSLLAGLCSQFCWPQSLDAFQIYRITLFHSPRGSSFFQIRKAAKRVYQNNTHF